MALGFGIIGCGMIANFHSKAIEDTRSAKLVACFDKFPASADRLAKSTGCTAYHDLDEMLADPAIDIVTIGTPSGAHMEPAIAAIRAGKHVIIEKPLEITLKRCDKIIAEAENSKAKGHVFLLEYYDSGAWRGTWELDGGGALMNQAIHSVDLLTWLMGPVAEIRSQIALLAHKRIAVEDHAVATLRFENGALGIIEASTAIYPGYLKRIEIHGTTGSAMLEEEDLVKWDFAKSRVSDKKIVEAMENQKSGGGGAADPTAIGHHGHARQFADVIKAIKKGTSPAIDGHEGRRSVEIILAIYKAAETGRAITLPLKSDPVLKARKEGVK